MKILDVYVKTAPTAQNALDIFEGEWSSALPRSFGLTTSPGAAGLFEDPRIAWAETTLGGFLNKSVLELGPLEGGHSYMCQSRGARRVVAVEANSRAFSKCLVIKEIFRLDRVEFKLGDFNEYLATSTDNFDLCIASGVLYHCIDPVDTIRMIAQRAQTCAIWTHYYDERIIAHHPVLQKYFRKTESRKSGAGTYVMARKDYHDALNWQGFCGGSEEYAYWLTRDSLIAALHDSGFHDIKTEFDQPEHPNGPAISICASK